MNLYFLFIAQFISNLGGVLFLISGIDIAMKSQNLLVVAGIQIAIILPAILLSKIGGNLIDKYETKKVLIYSDLFGAFLMLLFNLLLKLKIIGDPKFFVLFVGVAGCIDFLYIICRATYLGRILKADKLHKLTSVGMILQALVLMMSPILLILFPTYRSIESLALINGATYLISAFFIFNLKVIDKVKDSEEANVLAQLTLPAIFTNEFAHPRKIIIGSGVVPAVISLLVPIIGSLYFPEKIGVIIAQFFYFLGLILSSIIISKLYKKFYLNIYLVATTTILLVIALIKISTSPVSLSLLLLIMGIVVGGLDFAAYVFIQEHTNDEMRGTSISSIIAREKLLFIISIICFSHVYEFFKLSQLLNISAGLILIYTCYLFFGISKFNQVKMKAEV
jgi:hypothetical protein